MKKKPIKMARSTVILALLALLAITAVSIGAAPADAIDKDPAPAVQAEEGGVGSYVVLMEDWPLAVYEGEINHLPATKALPGEKVNTRSAAAKKYDAHLESSHKKARLAAGVAENTVTNTYTVALNGFSALMTEAEVEVMRRQEGVSLVMEDQWRQPAMDSVPDFLGLSGSRGAWHQGYDGEGVIVGIIDYGIWPEHPSFADDGYPIPDIVPLDEEERSSCDFGNTEHNENDAPFECNNKLVGARQMLDAYRAVNGAAADEYDSARDDNGHGTHAASTTAGNSGVAAEIFDIPRGTISGIAPRAQLIAYKALGNQGGLSSDLAAAVNQAVADGVDVINYGSSGGAAVPGADEIALLFAARAGVFVSAAAGNDGPGPSSVGNPGTMPWVTTVGASTQPRFWQGTVVLGDGSKYKGASITAGVGSSGLVDAADAGSSICVPRRLDEELVRGKIVLCQRGGVGRPVKSLAVDWAGGVGMILYDNNDEGTLAADEHWTPAVHVDNTPGLAIKAYIAAAGSEATAELITEQVSEWPYAPSMTAFSGRGPNGFAPDIIKPDLTAPGSQILAGYSPTPDRYTTVPGELFAALDGTSFSSPQVAGALVLLKQAHPDWSPAMAKSAVMTTAYQGVLDNDRVSLADPFDMGSGHLNLGRTVKNKHKHEFLASVDELDDKLKHAGRKKKPKPPKGSRKGSAFQPGLVYDASYFDYLGFLCDAYPELFGSSADALCATLENDGVATQATNLNYPSIGISSLPGTQTITRTVTSVAKENGWRKYKVNVDAPPGYKVKVKPSSIKLKRGQSATYEVTISNVSAPVGEWRFGSLTWRDQTRRYEAYSPIAVRAVLFDAPLEIQGQGTSGSDSFDVTFGYTGDYTAAPHGLEPATVKHSDNIVDDEEQSYEFTLSDALHFRVAMPPESTEPDVDLDLEVYDPNGDLAGLSESGDTNELVDIAEPMDGIWTVTVVGWRVPDGGVAYDMWTWAVPEASGGTLAVDSAPAAAELGTSGTVDISWSGLTGGAIGDWYLGAVSHSNDAGLIGQTLVNVDNR